MTNYQRRFLSWWIRRRPCRCVLLGESRRIWPPPRRNRRSPRPSQSRKPRPFHWTRSTFLATGSCCPSRLVVCRRLRPPSSWSLLPNCHRCLQITFVTTTTTITCKTTARHRSLIRRSGFSPFRRKTLTESVCFSFLFLFLLLSLFFHVFGKRDSKDGLSSPVQCLSFLPQSPSLPPPFHFKPTALPQITDPE